MNDALRQAYASRSVLVIGGASFIGSRRAEEFMNAHPEWRPQRIAA